MAARGRRPGVTWVCVVRLTTATAIVGVGRPARNRVAAQTSYARLTAKKLLAAAARVSAKDRLRLAVLVGRRNGSGLTRQRAP